LNDAADGRVLLRDLAAAVLAALDPEPLVAEALREPAAQPPFAALFALGKAAAGMARGAAGALGLTLDGEADGFRGLVARPASAPALFPGGAAPGGAWEEWPGGHPLPDVDSAGAGRGLLRLLGRLGPDDRLLALVSGGGSACCEVPAGVLSIADLAAAQRALLASGLPIGPVNAVRKHLSEIKGGGALRATAARVTVLVLSDVPGDELAVVASGPFAADPSTHEAALEAVRGLELPALVVRHLEAGARGELAETLKPGDPALARVEHRLLAGTGPGAPHSPAGAAAAWLAERGFRVERGELAGEAAAAGRELVAAGRRLEGERVALVLGGETTVTLGTDGSGTGGRNQELALAAARELAAGAPAGSRERVLSLATDGADGPTPAAGAAVDGATWRALEAAGAAPAEALARHDSHAALGRLEGALLTPGATGTNLADLTVYLRG
jgi:hydroxypyruvate reductase